MDPKLLHHLLQLAAKTGDRLIVVDPDSRQPFVLMGLPQYEALLARGDARGSSGGTALTSPVTMPMVPEGLDLGALARESERIEAATGVPLAPAHPVGFAPEPTTAALPDDDRFYVEPLE